MSCGAKNNNAIAIMKPIIGLSHGLRALENANN